MAEPIDLLFGLWSRVGRKKHSFNRIRHVAPMCHHGRAHWRHLANTIKPSVCGGDIKLLRPLVVIVTDNSSDPGAAIGPVCLCVWAIDCRLNDPVT